MYQVTLFDYNVASCCSGTFCCYCDDIEEFEREWVKLDQDERRVERFRRSKAGELVTDYYPTENDAALNIVQCDPEALVFFEHVLTRENLRMTARNAYDWPSVILADRGEFQVRYVRFQGEYLKLVKYKLYGVCQLRSEEQGIYQELSCYGNRILRLMQADEAPHHTKDRKAYRNDSVESIAYRIVKTYPTADAMREACRKPAEWFKKNELLRLLADIPGEAG